MIKPASAKCNASCKYCFYRDEVAVRSVKDYGTCSISLAHSIIKKALEYVGSGHLSIVFQGGEPTLAGYDFFNEFFSFIQNENVNQAKIFLSLQTNGLLIDEKWAKLFKKHNVLVGISLDGTKADNSSRVALGKEIYPDTLRAIAVLRDEGVPFNVLSVIHKGNVKSGKAIMQEFINRRFSFVQFIPYLGEQEEFMLTPEEYGAFLIDTFSIYGANFNTPNRISVREFDNYILLLQTGKAEQCGMNGRCEPQLVLEGDGTAFPCDFYCTDDYVLGNVKDDSIEALLSSPVATSFRNRTLPSDCTVCPYLRICHGGCKRYSATPFYCTSHKLFFQKHLGK